MNVGMELLVDAHGCRKETLCDLELVRALLERILLRLELRVVGEPQWHAFPGEGGVTGIYLLTESHLSIHTYPEHAIATLNLYCCRPKQAFPWEDELSRALGASHIVVRTIERGAT